MRTLTKILLVCTFLSFCCFTAEAASRRNVLKRLEDFRKFFVDFQYAPDNAVPGELLAQCYGVIIMREYKAGFVFGVRGGDGVVMLHDPATGQWSAPAFIVSAEGSFGFQIGGQSIDGIVLIMNRDGINMLLNTRFKIGVDASAAAGPVGRDASAKVGPGTALLAYSRAKGLYAGMAFEGGAMLNNDEYNRALYGRPVSINEILIERTVPFPVEAQDMANTLASYAAIQGAAVSVNRLTPTAPMAQPAPGEPIEPDVPELTPLQSFPEQTQAHLDQEARFKAEQARIAAEDARRAAEAAQSAADDAAAAARAAGR